MYELYAGYFLTIPGEQNPENVHWVSCSVIIEWIPTLK